MAIRFDKKFNAEIRREVDKLNKKFARARKAGYEKVPQNIKVSEIKEQFKSRYATRRELRRELQAYKRAKIKDLSKVVELETGQRVTLFSLKEAQRKSTRLLRKVNRDIKKEMAYLERAGGKDLPFGEHRQKLESLYDLQQMLREGVRKSETNYRSVNELYAREYSSSKKDAFETAFFNTLDSQIDYSNLSEQQKNELKTKLKSMSVDSLIDANKYSDELAEVMDRYKSKDSYTEQDKKVLSKTMEDLYNNIDDIITEFNI